MRYERSLVIEQRLDAVLRLVRTGQYSTPLIADELQVSIPTISRSVEALRDRGYDIVAENQNGTWRYILREHATGQDAMATLPVEFAGARAG